jgi:ribonuclease P protein component
VEDFFCTQVASKAWRSQSTFEAQDLEIERSTIKMASTGSFPFPKTRRLTHRSEYDRVERDGITQRGKFLMLNVMPVENSCPWRAGLVTSGRLGGAVVRNRIRRRLREIIRRHQHELRQGVWFVIIARREAKAAGYSALEDEWLRLAKRASILL